MGGVASRDFGQCMPMARPKVGYARRPGSALRRDPPPCLNYTMDHPLVQKQQRGEELSIDEVRELVQTPAGEDFERCVPATGTNKLHDGTKYECVKQRQPYTVCFDTRKHKLDSVMKS